MAPQEWTETPPQNSTPNNEVAMSGSTPLPTTSLIGSSSGPTNQQIFDLLLSLQQNNAKLEARLSDIEHAKSPGFEVLSSKDWENSDDSSSEFIGAIDQGTTSSRFLIFNTQGEPIAQHQMEFKQIYPNSGYVSGSTPNTCTHNFYSHILSGHLLSLIFTDLFG
jgi:glycerol kinase